MAKHITVRAAQPVTRDQEIESVYLTITGFFPYSVSDGAMENIRHGFKEDAAKVFEALRSLPGGTLDQLLILMLQAAVSSLIVASDPPLSDAEHRQRKAAPEMFHACETALNSLEYIENSHPNATGKAQRREAIDSLRNSLAKARGESEREDG
jgi:hypothetical protein